MCIRDRFDLRWYFRGYWLQADTFAPDIGRGCLESKARVEAKYPEECFREVSDDESNERWGLLAGKHAAVRWLSETDRSCAEDFFPFLDL